MPETLAHLARQKVRDDIRWEVLIIDNASTDATGEIAEELWPKEAPAPLRVAHEARPGLAYARLRGLAEARYEFLSFIDDDNWVCEDWVQIAYSQMLAHPQVGILGASSSPSFEIAPPAWFHQVEFMYAITPRTWKAGDFTHQPGTIWGAGMVVRKSAWLHVRECDSPQLLLGRLNNSMSGGEDTELSYQMRLAGWKLWYEPRLHFQHFLPAGRLRWEYVRRLFYGSGQAGARLRPYDFSLDGIDNQERARYTYSWSWSMLTAIKELLRHPLVSLKAILFSKEGDRGVLTVAALRGRIGMLMRTRKQYKSHVLEIQRFSARVRGQAVKTNPPAVAYATTGSATDRAGAVQRKRFAATPDTDGSSLPTERTITRGDGAESCRPGWSE